MKLATQKRNAGSRSQIESILKRLVDVKTKTLTTHIGGRRLDLVICVARGAHYTALAISGNGSPERIEDGIIRQLSAEESVKLFSRLNTEAEEGTPHKCSERAYRAFMGWLVENEAKQESSPFADWLKSVPPGAPSGADGNVTVPMDVTMSASAWMQLAQGASRNGWTLQQCVGQLLIHGSPGLAEWANNDFPSPEEHDEDTHATAMSSLRKGGAR